MNTLQNLPCGVLVFQLKTKTLLFTNSQVESIFENGSKQTSREINYKEKSQSHAFFENIDEVMLEELPNEINNEKEELMSLQQVIDKEILLQNT